MEKSGRPRGGAPAERVAELIEQSSLGSAATKAMRESVPREVGVAIATAARFLADKKELAARLAAVQAVRDQQPPRILTPDERRGWDLAMERVDAAMGAS